MSAFRSAADHAAIVAATRAELDSAIAGLASLAESTVRGVFNADEFRMVDSLHACRDRLHRANSAWLDSCQRRDNAASVAAR